MGDDFVGVAEIAELFGISRQRVNRIVQTHPDFPDPVAHLVAGRIWRRADVEEWAIKNSRDVKRAN
jgi:prophage regulatory protein